MDVRVQVFAEGHYDRNILISSKNYETFLHFEISENIIQKLHETFTQILIFQT